VLGDSGLTVRGVPPELLTADELAQIVELLRVAFNGGPAWFDLPVAPLDHLRWKIVDNPGAALAIVSEAESRIVGFAAQWLVPWLVQGKVRSASMGGDVALHPLFQGQGLTSLPMDEILRWLPSDFGFGFGSHPALLKRRAKSGTREPGGPMETLIRVLSVGRFARHRAPQRVRTSQTRIAIEGNNGDRMRAWPVRSLEWQRRIMGNRLRYRPVKVDSGDWTLRTVGSFDERVGGLFNEVAKTFDLVQLRDQAFLNWRYADPRAGGFVIRIAEQGDTLLGYAVTRTSTQQSDLADLLVVPGRPDVAYALIQDSVQQARDAGSFAMRGFMMRSHPHYDLLRRAGFVPVRSIVIPGYRARTMDKSELAFLDDPGARVHVMLGDSDHI
jgi:hypothetical protein